MTGSIRRRKEEHLMKRIGIIGGGHFGSALAACLAEKGAEVVLLDNDRETIRQLASVVSRAVQGDATNRDAISEAGMPDCDAVVVSIGTNMEASIMATMILKELKVKLVVAKAASDVHGKVLERLGADRVIYPHRDMAERLANSLWAPTVLDYFEISDGVSIMEVKAPKWLIGQSIADSKIRNVIGATVLSVIRAPDAQGRQEKIVPPSGDTRVMDGDTLILFGTDKDLEKLKQ